MVRKAARSFGSMVYSLIARIGPSSSATRLRKRGARQRIEGVRFRLAPVCSFQRQVSGMAIRAPAAAAARAKGSPWRLATSPHAAFPNVTAPK
jgi:hypothetical protein